MGRAKRPISVEERDRYYHVRYRDPDEFAEIRTPAWTESPAGSVVADGKLRMGDYEGNEDWAVQSVLVPVGGIDEAEAERLANRIVEKIDS